MEGRAGVEPATSTLTVPTRSIWRSATNA